MDKEDTKKHLQRLVNAFFSPTVRIGSIALAVLLFKGTILSQQSMLLYFISKILDFILLGSVIYFIFKFIARYMGDS